MTLCILILIKTLNVRYHPNFTDEETEDVTDMKPDLFSTPKPWSSPTGCTASWFFCFSTDRESCFLSSWRVLKNWHNLFLHSWVNLTCKPPGSCAFFVGRSLHNTSTALMAMSQFRLPNFSVLLIFFCEFVHFACYLIYWYNNADNILLLFNLYWICSYAFFIHNIWVFLFWYHKVTVYFVTIFKKPTFAL